MIILPQFKCFYVLKCVPCLFQIHQGFSSTAEAFARTAGQDIDEDITSIQNRQAIQKLVLAGRMGDAITMTNRLYPGFLQRHPSLHFMLKVKMGTCLLSWSWINSAISEVFYL